MVKYSTEDAISIFVQQYRFIGCAIGFDGTTYYPIFTRNSPENFGYSSIKGHLRILEALTLLDFPFCYFIVGEGQEREVIEAYIKQHQLESKVVLTGELKNPFPLLKNAHVYLQGSYSEAFPNVILEALCLGITPIAFDISGGTSEIIRSGENGFLAMETNDFASSINHVLEKPFLSHKLTETIHLFDLKNVMDIYSKLL